MDLENELYELLKKRENLLKAKEINVENLRKCNERIEYYMWALNRCLFEKTCFLENISSYRNLLNRRKTHNLFDFPFFDINFDKYYVKKINDLNEKIEVLDRKKNSLENLISIKKGERKYLENRNREIDEYIENTDKSIDKLEANKVLIKE